MSDRLLVVPCMNMCGAEIGVTDAEYHDLKRIQRVGYRQDFHDLLRKAPHRWLCKKCFHLIYIHPVEAREALAVLNDNDGLYMRGAE